MARVLALEEELEGSNIAFEYYGLPKPFDRDPVALEEGIHGVPVADVFVGGERLGRLATLQLEEPAAALDALLKAGGLGAMPPAGRP
jgi:hypothetical protein